jgi:hypothetical protein
MSKFSQIFKRLTSRSAERGRGVVMVQGTNAVLLLGIIIFFLGGLYLYQLNRSSTKSFAVSALVQQHEHLLQQRRDLELQQAQLSALSNLENASVVSQLVASTDVEYLTPATSDVARR